MCHRARREEEERLVAEAEAKAKAEKEAAEAVTKAKAEEAKKEKEAAKKAVKKERKVLRTFCKENDFFAGNDDALRVQRLSDVDKLCELLEATELEDLNKRLLEKGKCKDGKD